MKLNKLELDKISYHNNDKIKITLEIKNSEIKTENLTNININIYKLGEHRNEFAFGFGSLPILESNKFHISQKLSDSLKDGIYFIRHIKLLYGDTERNNHYDISLLPKDDFELKFFHITHEEDASITYPEINKRIELISNTRTVYRNKTIVTPSAAFNKKSKDFSVLIFGVGCLIHNVQEMNGYTIYPIKSGLNYSNMNNPVNDFLSKKFHSTLPFNSKIDEEFRKSTPLFVIDFGNVKAINYNDALYHCNETSQTIFSILGYKKGQRPSLFAFVVKDKSNSELFYNFQFPGYSGNLVSEFSPTATANDIDKLTPLLNSNPWLKFVFDSHAFALNETNIDLKYFRLWAISELIAKKEVGADNLDLIDADKQPIVFPNGNQRKTKSTLEKVYYYIYHSNLNQTTSSSSIPGEEYSFMFEMDKSIECQKGTEKIKLWDAISAMYAIRNATAHKGKFILEEAKQGDWKDKLAAKYYPIGHNMLLNQLENIVKNVIDKQIAEQTTLHNRDTVLKNKFIRH